MVYNFLINICHIKWYNDVTLGSSICFDDVTAVVIKKKLQNNQRPWASWKTSAYTPTHSHTRIKKSLCCFAMPHIANPPTRQNITHRAKHSNPPPLRDCMCDCKNMQVFVPQVTQISAECEPKLTLDVESTLSTAHKCKVCILLFYSPTPLLSSFARKLWGRWPVPPAGFHFQYCGVTGGWRMQQDTLKGILQKKKKNCNQYFGLVVYECH